MVAHVVSFWLVPACSLVRAYQCSREQVASVFIVEVSKVRNPLGSPWASRESLLSIPHKKRWKIFLPSQDSYISLKGHFSTHPLEKMIILSPHTSLPQEA
jgi:hypothetical protein